MVYEKSKIMKLQSELDDRLFTGDKKRLLEIANELSKPRVADSLKAVAISTLDIKFHDKDKIYLF